MISSEIAPYAKVGGLADVVSSLSKELAQREHEVKIICPLYGFIATDSNWQEQKDLLSLKMNDSGQEFCRIWRVNECESKAALYFLENEKYFGENQIYHTNEANNEKIGQRFVFFSRAAIEFCRHSEWTPDIIHCHDWMTGIVPIYLKLVEKDERLSEIPTVLTIHNIQHQGIFDRKMLDFAQMPQTPLIIETLGFEGSINFLKGGILCSKKLIAVSERYAYEIVNTKLGYGLDAVLGSRKKDLIGILNGIDTTIWNPEIDQYIPKNFKVDDMSGKKECKKFLQRHFNLEEREDIAIFAVVARLYWQKGLDLLLDIIPRLMNEEKLQIVVLGTGESDWEERFKTFALEYEGQIGVNIGHNQRLPHLIEAGSDFFLMPSRFEPCGLSQMYSMVYGSIPIVHATGGLIDTVEPYQSKTMPGTGFMFEEATSEALYKAILKACDIFYHNNNIYRLMQVRGMKKDFSWKKSVEKHENVYLSAQ